SSRARRLCHGRGVLRVRSDRGSHGVGAADRGISRCVALCGIVERVARRPVATGGDGGEAMSGTMGIWSDDLLKDDLGDHPLDPVRVELTIALARMLGILDRPGVRVVAPEPADDATIGRIHEAGYIRAVKAAPEEMFYGEYGLGTGDNPIFPQ